MKSSNFKFNDAVIRNMIIQRKEAITGNSSILLEEQNNKSEDDSNLNASHDDTKLIENGVENV